MSYGCHSHIRGKVMGWEVLENKWDKMELMIDCHTLLLLSSEDNLMMNCFTCTCLSVQYLILYLSNGSQYDRPFLSCTGPGFD